MNNSDHSNSVLKHWIIYTWINFSLGYLCCEINFGRTKNLKIAWSFCAKVFLRIIWIKLFLIRQVLKPPLQKLALGRFFFNSTKWLKAYETGYPIFVNNFLKPERVVCSKCQHCSSIKMTSLKLVKSGELLFHANYRIPDCETKTKYKWYNWLPIHVNMSWALGLKSFYYLVTTHF